MKYIPLFLDLHDKKVTIFGGGEVGERKAGLFSKICHTKVVSRDFTDMLLNMRHLELIKVDELTDRDISNLIEDAFLVIPATSDRDLNDHIEKIARLHGKLINSVDSPGDVVVPSVITRGEIIIGISTQGKSPALTKFIRQRIEETITPEYEMMMRLQEEIRAILKSRIKEQKRRKEILWRILEDKEVWSELSDSYERAYTIALKHID